MRDRWSSRTIFLFATIGSAVGLGNIWRFPYLTYKFGGGAFLLPYLIALIIIGIPLLIMEFALGQKFQQGIVGTFSKINLRLEGLGIATVMLCFFVVSYYAVVMAWALIYFFRSLHMTLPWTGIANSYFADKVLMQSQNIETISSINPLLLLGLIVVWMLIYFSIWKGVNSVGKILKVLIPVPGILLVIMLIRGLTLDGAMIGIYHYLKPSWNALLSTEIWIAAASQIFFTLSLGFGVMIAYASYNKKNENLNQDALITAVANSSISLFAGFVVFSILGYMATSTGVSVDTVVASGPGLAFVVFPQAISMMPWAPLFAALFFLMLITLGIDSAFSMVEGVTTVASDKFKISTEIVALVVCVFAFIAGVIFTTDAGIYFLDIVDHFLTEFGLILMGIFQSIAVGWIFGAEKLREFMNSVSSWQIGKWWNVSIKYIIPISLSLLFVSQFFAEIKSNYGDYPSWAITMGWLTVFIPFAIIVYYAIKSRKSIIQSS